MIEDDELNLKEIFNSEVQNKLKSISIIGNSEEQLYLYDFENDFFIALWNIKGFNEISPDKIELVSNSAFDKILINPQNYSYYDVLKMRFSSKLEHLSACEILIHLSQNSSLNDSDKRPNMLRINVMSKGFAISDKDFDYKLKVEFNEYRNFSIWFTNRLSSFQIILLVPKNQARELGDDVVELFNVF